MWKGWLFKYKVRETYLSTMIDFYHLDKTLIGFGVGGIS